MSANLHNHILKTLLNTNTVKWYRAIFAGEGISKNGCAVL